MAIGLSLLITVLVTILTEPTQEDVLTDVFPNDTTSFFIRILAIVGITGEWRHRTITSSLLARRTGSGSSRPRSSRSPPRECSSRSRSRSSTAVIGFAILEFRDLPTPELAELIEQFGRNAARRGAARRLRRRRSASMIRNQPTAIVAILIYGFAIDSTLSFLAPGGRALQPHRRAADVHPGTRSRRRRRRPSVDYFSAGLALLLMLVWIGGLFAAGAALLKARDVD